MPAFGHPATKTSWYSKSQGKVTDSRPASVIANKGPLVRRLIARTLASRNSARLVIKRPGSMISRGISRFSLPQVSLIALVSSCMNSETGCQSSRRGGFGRTPNTRYVPYSIPFIFLVVGTPNPPPMSRYGMVRPVLSLSSRKNSSALVENARCAVASFALLVR